MFAVNYRKPLVDAHSDVRKGVAVNGFRASLNVLALQLLRYALEYFGPEIDGHVDVLVEIGTLVCTLTEQRVAGRVSDDVHAARASLTNGRHLVLH